MIDKVARPAEIDEATDNLVAAIEAGTGTSGGPHACPAGGSPAGRAVGASQVSPFQPQANHLSVQPGSGVVPAKATPASGSSSRVWRNQAVR